MFPNDARLKKLTYAASLLSNIGLLYIIKNDDGSSFQCNVEKWIVV